MINRKSNRLEYKQKIIQIVDISLLEKSNSNRFKIFINNKSAMGRLKNTMFQSLSPKITLLTTMKLF